MDDEPQITELGHNTMLVNHAGYGVTPECSGAKFHVGQVLKAKWRKELCCVVAIVPPGFPAEYAIADLHKKLRPLMITRPKRTISYIVGFVGDEQPNLYRESNLRATDEPDSLVQWKVAPMTELQALVEMLEALAAKATPGPRQHLYLGGTSTITLEVRPPRSDNRIPAYAYDEKNGHCIGYPALFESKEGKVEIRLDFICMSHQDAAFITACSPDNILKLCAAIKSGSLSATGSGEG